MATVACPSCGTVVSNSVSLQGKTAACLKCGARFKLPPILATAVEPVAAPVAIRTASQTTAVPTRRRVGLSWLAASALALLVSLVSITITVLVVSDDSSNEVARNQSPQSRQRGSLGAREKTWEAELQRQKDRLQLLERQLTSQDLVQKQREAQIRAREQAITKREIEIRLKGRDARIGGPDAAPGRQEPLPENEPADENKPPKPAEEDRVESVAELVKQQIAILHTDPSPNGRAAAAMMLGQLPEQSQIVVPALQSALQKEVSPQVATAIIHAFANVGSAANSAIVTLHRFITTTKNDALRREAFEALIAIDHNSSAVQKVLTIALVGGSGTNPISSRNSRVEHLTENRRYALEKLVQLANDAKWAIPILVKLTDVTVKDYIDEPYSTNDGILIKIIEALLAIDPRDSPSYAALKRAASELKSGSGERDAFTSLRVRIDSALKEMESLRREQDEK